MLGVGVRPVVGPRAALYAAKRCAPDRRAPAALDHLIEFDHSFGSLLWITVVHEYYFSFFRLIVLSP